MFTFNGDSANATAIDVTNGTVVGTVALGGKPETPVLDGKGSIFVNIETKNSLAEFDAKTLVVKHTYPLPGCKGPSGIAMDTASRRVFAMDLISERANQDRVWFNSAAAATCSPDPPGVHQ